MKASKREERKKRTQQKHQKIRDLYEKRYTKQKLVNGAKIYTKDYVMAKLAEEYFLSIRQIENIIYTTPKTLTLPAAAGAPGAPAAAEQQPLDKAA